PWSKRSEERLDPQHAREVLDADHAGLDDVKERITEYLAVRKLRAERGLTDDRRSGAILTLIGPPGTGKTSIGESIARATGRQFVRMSLGGVRDEAEIRGHRRTYIGALPGRLVRALRDAGTMNPVILLDEVDKLGADWRGDPSAALLDRLEVIRIDGYTEDEKVAIASRYLVPRAERRNGLKADEVAIEDEALRRIITEYTREAGVRNVERLIQKVLRKSAKKLAEGAETPIVVAAADLRELLGRPRPDVDMATREPVAGVATGLAVTGSGGDVLVVEATSMAGKGLTLTGQLGDVMSESATIALSYVRSHGDELGIDVAGLAEREVHVHVPAGAIPKDGPSAGVTLTVALVSLISGRAVRADVGMTGEVTLQGRVLPVGGIKQKVLAAHRAGLTDVILPARNGGDLDELPQSVLEAVRFHLVDHVDEALAVALEPAPAAIA
ncbi:MAG: ATP-dependent Lon protease, partial [Gaiellales bacterium]|nr:ATP-dependent Lon protease [Gaiellales bacterium]